MNYLDIHSHILPAVDDGANDIETAIELLEILKKQGVTHIIATPHFYPDTDSASDFAERVGEAYQSLSRAVCGKELPKVYLGCELHYFGGMGRSKSLRQFAIHGTNYILLELQYGADITNAVLQDIIDIYEHSGLLPIFAHIERYSKLKGYKKLLKLIAGGNALAQINAESVISKSYGKTTQKLIKSGLVSFLASDTHSINARPPLIEDALTHITEHLGKSAATRIIIKSNELLDEIEAANV